MFKAKNGKIYLYDTIDVPGSGGVSGLDVIDALDSFDGGDVEIHINSPGGSAFEGISIYNSLKSYPGKVTTYNDSVAASISSIIFLAGEERQAAPGSFFMMHNAWSYYGGNAEELRKHAELLEQADDTLIGIYESETNWNRDTVQNLMRVESWLSSDEQLSNSVAHNLTRREKVEPVAIAASSFKHTPKELVKNLEPGSRTKYLSSLAELELKLKMLKSKNR